MSGEARSVIGEARSVSVEARSVMRTRTRQRSLPLPKPSRRALMSWVSMEHDEGGEEAGGGHE